LALAGVAVLAAAGYYDMRTFRESPKISDAAHSVMQESHGVQRYKIPEQVKTFRSLNIAGVAVFGVAATLLLVHKRFDKKP